MKNKISKRESLGFVENLIKFTNHVNVHFILNWNEIYINGSKKKAVEKTEKILFIFPILIISWFFCTFFSALKLFLSYQRKVDKTQNHHEKEITRIL